MSLFSVGFEASTPMAWKQEGFLNVDDAKRYYGREMGGDGTSGVSEKIALRISGV